MIKNKKKLVSKFYVKKVFFYFLFLVTSRGPESMEDVSFSIMEVWTASAARGYFLDG